MVANTQNIAGPPPFVARRKPLEAAPRVVRECEQACRALSAAALGASQFTSVGARVERPVHVAVDCSFFAAACARALSRFECHDLETIVALVDVCKRAADECAVACGRRDTPHMLRLCGVTARTCAASCAALLTVLHADVVLLQEEDSPE